MLRGTPLLFWLTLVLQGLIAGQAPAAPGSAQTDPQNDGKTKPSNPGVYVLKSSEPPPPPSQSSAPMLRAVDLEKRPKLDQDTRKKLILLLDAEVGRVRKSLPQGDKSLVIDPQGRLTPNDANLYQLAQLHGSVAKVGDKVQITNVSFHDKSISFAINGGPRKKGHWYDHVSVGVGGAGGGITPINGDAPQPQGAGITVQFNKQIPEMTGDELKQLLSPVLDFSTKSAGEVYTETLPPKVQNAIKKHEVLVGMNRDMVILAKDRPLEKVREKDEKGRDYEDWMYGKPPQDVIFVRFIGDEVTQVKTAKVGGEVTIKTEKEIDVKEGMVSLAALKASNSPEDVKPQSDQPEQSTRRPTLKRQGEDQQPSLIPPPSGTSQDEHKSEPDWGTDGKQQPPPETPKPPQ